MRNPFSKRKIVLVNMKEVNTKYLEYFYDKTKKSKLSKTKAILVSLDSFIPLNHSIALSNIIQEHNRDINLSPIYTFSEDNCLGNNLIPLVSGKKAFCDESTIFGFFDFTAIKTNYAKFVKERDIKINVHTKGENKFKLNPFEPYKDQDVDWLLDILKQKRNIFLDEVIKKRLNNIEKDGVIKVLLNNNTLTNAYNSNSNVKEYLSVSKKDAESVKKWKIILDENLGSTFIIAKLAKDLGLIDEFKNFYRFRNENYADHKIVGFKQTVTDILRQFDASFIDSLSNVGFNKIFKLMILKFLTNSESIERFGGLANANISTFANGVSTDISGFGFNTDINSLNSPNSLFEQLNLSEYNSVQEMTNNMVSWKI